MRSLNIQALASALTNYYMQFQTGLHKEFEFGLLKGKHNLADRFTVLTGIPDRLTLGSVTADDFLHQHDPTDAQTFNPQDDVLNVTPREYVSRDFEGDLLFLDKDIERTWLMFQQGVANIEKMKAEEKMKRFVEYLFATILNEKAMRTLRKAAIKATFSSARPYAWNKILDGFETVIANEIVAGNITPVVLNAITPASVVVEVESVYDALSEEVQQADDLIIALKSSVFKAFVRANRKDLGRDFDYSKTNAVTIDGYPNAIIVNDPDAAYKVVAYRKSEAILGVNFTEGGAPWEFQRADRTTKMMMNGKIGFEFQTVNKDRPNIAVGN